MKRQRKYLLAVLFSVLPLLLILGLNELIYDALGTPRRRGLFAFFKVEQPGSSDPIEDATYELPPVSGSPDDPLAVFFIGSSMTQKTFYPEHGAALAERLKLEYHNLSRPAQPIDRYDDLIRLVREKQPIDLVVIEFSPLFCSDEHLVFRSDTFRSANWSGDVLNPKLRALRRAIEIEERGPDGASPPDTRASLETLERRTQSLLEMILPAPLRTPVSFSSELFQSSWSQASGVEDLAKKDRVWVRSQLLALASLDLIHERCRAGGIGLVVFVPPRAPDLRLPERDPPPLQAAMARHALPALSAWARARSIPLLNYDAWSDQESDFTDSIHLNEAGSRRLSQRFFKDLGTILDERRIWPEDARPSPR